VTEVVCVRLDSEHWLLDVSASASDQLVCFVEALEHLTLPNESAYLIARGDAAAFGARLEALGRTELRWRVVMEADGLFEAVVSSSSRGTELAVH
jgi:hypothetical protein